VKTRLPIVVAALLAVTAAGCRKAPEPEQSAAQTPAPAGGTETPAPPPPKPMPAELPDILARVNGEPVTKADFDRLLKNIESSGRGAIPAERRDEILRSALDQLVTYNVMKQEAAARGLTVSDAEIDQQLQQMQKQFPSEAEFKKALDVRNTTVAQLKSDARVDMSIDKMMQAELATTIATEAEAKEFYDKNPDQFKQAESAQASHILIMADEKADEATKKAARAKIDSVYKRVKAGEDFAKLARENSQDGSAQQGGDLGEFTRGQMVPAFDEAAFKLKPGEVSEVVTTQFGYHIIKLTSKKDPTTYPYEQVKPKIVEVLTNRKKQEKVNAFIEAMKKKAKIEVLV
jgi:peptidyl-prolyl cis-trans isomerase C